MYVLHIIFGGISSLMRFHTQKVRVDLKITDALLNNTPHTGAVYIVKSNLDSCNPDPDAALRKSKSAVRERK